MAYLLELLRESFWDTWRLVVVKSMPAAMIALSIFIGSYFYLRRRNRHDEARDRFNKWVEAALFTGAGFVVVFVFNFLYFTPQKMVLEARAKQSTAEPVLSKEDAAREWPPLTPGQIEEWAKQLAPYHIRKIRVAYGREVEAKRFFRSLQVLGKRLDCEVIFMDGSVDGPYVQIYTPQNASSGPTLLKLFQTLSPAKLDTVDNPDIEIFLPDRP